MNDHFATKEDICTHLGDDYDRYLGAVTPPIFQNSLFVRKHNLPTNNPGYSYSRVSNPTMDVVEEKIAALEQGEGALVFSAGMGAISAALLSCLKTGDHVITLRRVYGGTSHFLNGILTRFGVTVTYVPTGTPEEYEAAIQPNTRVFYLESPSTATFELQDISAIVAIAKSKGIATIIDNTWATPMYQNPLTMGVDLVCHSASKYLGGHSDLVAGALIGSKERINAIRGEERCALGSQLEPFGAWLLARGIRTLPIRMRQHQKNALKVASYLQNHPKVKQVMYPGLPDHPQYELGKKQMWGYSSLFSFVPIGETEKIWEAMDSLRFFQQGPSWGGYESLIISFGVGLDEAGSKASGIPVNAIRLHIGLEDPDTLIEDLDTAFQKL